MRVVHDDDARIGGGATNRRDCTVIGAAECGTVRQAAGDSDVVHSCQEGDHAGAGVKVTGAGGAFGLSNQGVAVAVDGGAIAGPVVDGNVVLLLQYAGDSVVTVNAVFPGEASVNNLSECGVSKVRVAEEHGIIR